MAAILLEISYTRIFSFKLYYYFTYLTIGIALLGLGSGGVFVAVSSRLRGMEAGRLVGGACLLASLVIPLGYWIVATTQLNALDIADSPVEALKLVWVCTVLFAPFLLVGICLATIFGARSADITRLYSADLVGAGLGCVICIPLFYLVSPPGCVFLSGVLFAVVALFLSARERTSGRWASGAIAVALLAGVIFPGWLPDPVVDRVKTLSPQRGAEFTTLFSRWSTVFRVDVIDGGDPDTRYLLAHDGNQGSALIHFDGDFSALQRFEIDPRSTPFAVLPPNPKVLIIGSAGGHEILASLYFGAEHVTAVELNPVTVSLLTEHFVEYTGGIGNHERVTLINGEGRSFIARDQNKYDLIWFVAPDSYAAMNAASSGAFVLSESYLYTKEMILEALDHLSEGGLIALQTGDIDFLRKPNRATRYLATAREAFAARGISDFGSHVLVSSVREMFTLVTILLSNEPISTARVIKFHENAAVVKPVGKVSTVAHPGTDEFPVLTETPVAKVINLPDGELAQWYESYPYDVTPVIDDAPFFWHFAGFWDSIFDPLDTQDYVVDPEDAKGERVLLVLLALTVVFSAVFLLLPLVAMKRVWGELPHKLSTGLYFSCLGLGFMFYEVCLIQKLTLFLGYPTYSVTVTLFAILTFSGIGSLVSSRYATDRNRALRFLVGGLVVLAFWYQFGMTYMVEAYGGAVFPARVALAVVALAPLGLCLGAFMPIGIATVSELSPHVREYVAWSWAVNGFFSVISSVLSTILAMTFGFSVVLGIALVVYIIGALAFSRIPVLGKEALPS